MVLAVFLESEPQKPEDLDLIYLNPLGSEGSTFQTR